MKKICFIWIVILSYCAQLSAQTVTDNPLQKVFTPQMFALSNFSLQAGLNNTVYTEFYKKPTTAIDLRFAYDMSARCVFGLQANLLGAMNYNYTDGMKAKSDTLNDYLLNYELTFSTMNIYLFNRIYLANNTHKRWGLYMATNVGAALVKVKAEPTQSYDANKYEPRPQGIQAGAHTIPTAGLGLGAHWKVGAFLLLPEVMMCMPLNSVKSPYSYNPLPFHFQFNAGVAVPFGKRE